MKNPTQLVQEPTRQNNILDLVLTTHPDLIEGTYVVPGMNDHNAVICDINFKTKPSLNPPRSVYLYKRTDMGGLQEQLRNSYKSFQASEPSTKLVEENWTLFKTILFGTIKKHIPQRPLAGKSLLHRLIHALNVLFAKSSDVTMLPHTAIVNKIGANSEIFENWCIMKCEKLAKTTSIIF